MNNTKVQNGGRFSLFQPMKYEETLYGVDEEMTAQAAEHREPWSMYATNRVIREWWMEWQMGRWGQGKPAHPVGGPVSPVPAGPSVASDRKRLF